MGCEGHCGLDMTAKIRLSGAGTPGATVVWADENTREGIFELETEKWVGPEISQYGTHLVYIMHKNPYVVYEFETIKELVTKDLQREKQIELNEKYIDGILTRYEVFIEREE